jgi:hypothetical protein
MNVPASKTVKARLQEQIQSYRKEAEEAKGRLEYEFAFMLIDKADQLQAQLDDIVEIYKT